MSLPYTLVEKSVLRKPGSTSTIGDVLTETKAWLDSLELSNSVANFYYYADVVDGDTMQRYFVYSDEAMTYFGLADNFVVADSAANNPIISKLSEDENGNLLYNGALIEGGATTSYTIGNSTTFVGYTISDTAVVTGNTLNFDFSDIPFYNPANKNQLFLKKDNQYIFTVDTRISGADRQLNESFGVTLYDHTNDRNLDDGTFENSYAATWGNGASGTFVVSPKEDITVSVIFSYEGSIPTEVQWVRVDVTETKFTSVLDFEVEAPGYSTDEVLTTERWIDGKPIYRKTYTGTSLTSSTSAATINVLGDNPAGLETLVNARGQVITNTGSKIALPYIYSANGIIDNINCRSASDAKYPNKLTLSVGNSWANGIFLDWSMTLHYTKSTDTAESPVASTVRIEAKYDIGAVEYDTGITRGGKKVYGIEVDFGAMPNATTKTVAIPNYNAGYKYWIDVANSYTFNSTTLACLPLPYISGDAGLNYSVSLAVVLHNIRIITWSSSWDDFTETKVVLNYTKD